MATLRRWEQRSSDGPERDAARLGSIHDGDAEEAHDVGNAYKTAIGCARASGYRITLIADRTYLKRPRKRPYDIGTSSAPGKRFQPNLPMSSLLVLAQTAVPDFGSTGLLLGIAIVGLGICARLFKSRKD